MAKTPVMKFLSPVIASLSLSVRTTISFSITETSNVRSSDSLSRSLADETKNPFCKPHTVDFVMVEGDAVRTGVEQEIVRMLARVGVTVNTRKLSKEEFNAAEQDGDFHLSFSETWGAPYDPHAYAKGWVAGDEGHRQALTALEAPDTRDKLFQMVEDVLRQEDETERKKQWEAIHAMVHRNAVMLPLWGARIPTVMNTERLTNFVPGNQQFDYPVNQLEVLQGESTTVTIAPGAQTGLFQSVGRLDPHTYRPNEFFANNWVYEGLVSYGSYGQVLPALASRWSITDLSGGGQRYVFSLRPNVTFHDGAEWNCAAAKLNLDHVLAGPLRGPDWHGWYGLMSQISSWECISDLVLAIDTKNKYYPFLQELSFIRPLRMLSPNAFAGDKDPFNSNSCHKGWGTIPSDKDGEPSVVCAGTTAVSGTGPFMLGDSTVTDVIFQRNPTYWNNRPSSPSTSSVETLVVKGYDTSADVKQALLDGDLDLVWGSGVLSAQDLLELDQDKTNNLAVFHSDDIQNVILLLNTGKAPLDDIKLRKTIIHAIDKKTIIDNELGGIFKPVDNVFPVDAPYCDVDMTPRWDYDLEKAEFLNCPITEAPQPLPTLPPQTSQVLENQTEEKTQEKEDNTLALGLGIGLGLTSVVLLVLTLTYFNRSKELELELKKGGTSA